MNITESDFLRYNAMEFVRNHNDEVRLRTGLQPTAYTHSFGCQQNVADGETIEGLLLEMGFSFSDKPETADIVIFNTCAVRENAENTVFGNVGELKSAKEANPNMIIGICGCMTQQKHISDKIRKSYPFVDLLFGSGMMGKLPELLQEKLLQGGRVFKVENPTTEMVENLPVKRENHFKASVPIMSGCNNFCSYCVVPYVRGRERSRAFDAVVSEVTHLIDSGYKEIMLLGQNVNSYGNDLVDNVDFSTLIATLAKLDGDFIIRFMTSHPKDCTTKLIDVIADNSKISKHIHLPVQSGSNRILELMNRKYTVEDYMGLVEYAKEKIPEVSFSTDIIIGFPSEREDDFQETYDLVEKVGYSAVYSFAYSPRIGTKAAEMQGDLSHLEKTNRFERLLKLQREKSNEHNSQMVGKTFRVLVEDFYKNQNNAFIGRTDNGVSVVFDCAENCIGDFVNITITEYMDWAVKGQIIQKEV